MFSFFNFQNAIGEKNPIKNNFRLIRCKYIRYNIAERERQRLFIKKIAVENRHGRKQKQNIIGKSLNYKTL